MLRKIAFVVEFLVLAATFAVVTLMFTNNPTQPPPAPAAVVEAAGGVDGSLLYKKSCARCHGGDGSGGIGPKLAGKVLVSFPDAADQIAVVTNGRKGMPAFSTRLTEAEIAAIVDFTRTTLSGA